MSKLYLKKKNGVLIPSLPNDEEIFRQWHECDILECNIKKPRNIKFHRKFMALLNVVFDNQEIYTNFDAMRYEITMRSGFFMAHTNIKGETMYFPKSIAFANMDELEFNKLFDKAIDVILKHFMPKASRQEIDKMVLITLSFA